jgi:hypothetical protein
MCDVCVWLHIQIKGPDFLFDIVPEECASKAYISKHQQDLTSVQGKLCRVDGAEQVKNLQIILVS